MQSVSSKIWTCVAVSTTYDNNHYTTGNFFCDAGKVSVQLYFLSQTKSDYYIRI